MDHRWHTLRLLLSTRWTRWRSLRLDLTSFSGQMFIERSKRIETRRNETNFHSSHILLGKTKLLLQSLIFKKEEHKIVKLFLFSILLSFFLSILQLEIKVELHFAGDGIEILFDVKKYFYFMSFCNNNKNTTITS